MSSPVSITVVDKAGLPAWLETHPAQREWLATTGFSAEPGSFAFVPAGDGQTTQVIAARNKGGGPFGLAHLATALPVGRYALDPAMPAADATDAALGWQLGAYAFTRYKKPRRAAAELDFPEQADRAQVEALAKAVMLARDLINTPAEDMGPAELVAAAEAVARQAGAEVSVIRGDDLLSENYPCVHAVGRASSRPPALVDFIWGDPSAPKVTLVGKGVCFDTGGLDLKPAASMLQMKKDMGGAAVVIGLAQALMAARLPIRLRVLVPAVENSVSGNAIRPLDVLTTRLGKTVEIGNTDAEGRLILCDALAEADSESPDLLIDCATLTGAARVALGAGLQALFCDDDDAAADLHRVGLAVDDPVWRLPLWRAYRPQFDSRVADMNNVSGQPQGGAIIAALYLSEFVSKARTWMHLDIAGSNPKTRPGRPEGGEATGLRALYAFIVERYR